ncbi:MAG TPA: hypothetical protein VI112_11090 [Bacteroidia bacterium]|jgi:hypothetical protein
MRIIGTIPHPSISISVFHMNDKFIVKMEAGPMEQTIKFREDEVKGVEDIKSMLDEEFMKKALERFNEMFSEMKRVKSTK